MYRVDAAFAAAGLAMLTLLWVLLKPDAAPAAVAAAPSGVSSSSGAAHRVAYISIRDGQHHSGPTLVQLRQGDRLTLQLQSDRVDDWDLPAYKLKARLQAGESRSITFTASRSGRFEHSLRRSGKTLGVVEVLPR